MESVGNVSDALFQFSSLLAANGTGAFCRNFSTNTSLADPDMRCNRTGDPGKGSTPVLIAIIITAVYSIVCVVGLVGNVLVMYVIIR